MAPGLNCSKCGGNRFRYPPSIHAATPIVCEDCGHSAGTFAELMRKFSNAVLNRRA